jgi:polysaccharide deacetylase family protein (PEP-CTERM system associated)
VSSFLASFDVEDWFHAENLKSKLSGADWTTLEGRVERNTHDLLDILAEVDVKSTFFVLGWVARRYPAMVRRIVADGHEVASHSDKHLRLYDLDRTALIQDLAAARDALEQLAGTRVWGIRAPIFSISDQVLDCLAESGYWYDSSYYAFRAHDRYGRLQTTFDSGKPVIEVRPGLLELPMSRVQVGPAALPWAGGGYFRLIPYPVFRWGVVRRLRAHGWFMFYFHPWELDVHNIAPPGLSRTMRFRTFVGRGRMRRDLHRLLAEFGSRRIDETLRSHGYTPPGDVASAPGEARSTASPVATPHQSDTPVRKAGR